MITHYGLFWSERNVFWGKQNTPGVLLGRQKTPLGRRGAPSKAEKATAFNYREYVGLYCLYSGTDLIYIGEAGLGTKSTLYSRLKQHRGGSVADRWDTFSWFGRENCEGQTENSIGLAQLEAVSISIINPGSNKQSGTFVGATQVFQVPHEASEGDLETKLARLSEQISAISKNNPRN